MCYSNKSCKFAWILHQNGGVYFGSCKDHFRGNIYHSLHRVDRDHPDAGREVCRVGRDRGRGGYLLGQKQRPFYGRDAGEDDQGADRPFYFDLSGSESWSF